ncbi:hypothetical protein, partial [Rhizobacter sp. P5_C2]
MNHPHHTRLAPLALGLMLAAGAAAWGSRMVIRLGEARTASTAEWRQVAQVYAERNRLAVPALQAAGTVPGV